MSNALRTLALTAAMAGLAPMAAQASVVLTDLEINFDAAGGWPLNQPGPIDYTAGVRISNGQLIQSSTGLALVSGGVSDPIANPITITFTQPDLYQLNQLTLDHSNGLAITVRVHGVKGGNQSFKLESTGFNSNGDAVWKRNMLGCTESDVTKCPDVSLLPGDEFISSLEFVPTQDSGTGQIDFPGVNLLNFALTSTTPGGNVPEPAGYGLAALALLAAGAASRRRNAR